MTALTATAAGKPAWLNTAVNAVQLRLEGPGGLYNLGNAIGLAAGLMAQFAVSGSSDLAATATAAGTYFAGDGSAVALTVATAFFFWSGERYHRAWQGRKPDLRLKKEGDILSGFGAAALAVSLFLLGNPLLAATSGILHAAGKFGSAIDDDGAPPSFRRRLADWSRRAVFVSRFPALLLAILQLSAAMSAGSAAAIAMPLTLLACLALWARADWLLLRNA